MAVLEKIRERGLLIAIIVGIATLAFVVDPDKIITFFNSTTNDKDVFGSINEEEIDIDQYNNYYDNLDTLTQKTGLNSSRENRYTKEESHEIAWESLVNEKLIASATSDLGLTVTPEELKELETGSINPANISQFFRNALGENFNDDSSGTYTSKVQNFLANRSNWPSETEKAISSIEDQVSKERLSQKYLTLIEKGMYTTRQEAEKIYNSKYQNATVEYVSIPYSSDKIDVSDEEIESYYNNNISLYQNEEETRNVEYVAFTIVPSLEDHKDIKQDMISEGDKKSQDFVKIKNCITESYKKAEDIIDPNFTKLITNEEGTVEGPYPLADSITYRLAKLIKIENRPDSVKASQILLQINNDSVLYQLDTLPMNNESDLISFAKKLQEQIESETEDQKDSIFGQIAKQFSDHTESKHKEGDLGWFSEGKMFPEFNDTCFTSKIGDLKIVTTQDGVHLIKIDDVSDSTPEKYQIAYLDKEVKPSENTIKDFHNKAKRFRGLAYDQNLVQEVTESKSKILQYWWLLLDIGIIFVLFYFIYIKKRNIRKFVPYILLAVLVVTGAGIYFGSEAEEDPTILTADNAFESLAEGYNYKFEDAKNVHNMQFTPVEKMGESKGTREIVKWMFDANTKVGDVSNEIYKCGDDFVLVSLSAINPKGNKKLENVRDDIRGEIQTNKKFDAISNLLSGSPTLDEAASLEGAEESKTVENVTFDNNNVTGIGTEQNFVGAVNSLDSAQTSPLIKGNNAAYVIEVVSKGSRTKYDLIDAETQKSIQNPNSSGVFYNAVLETLKENSDIVDNRYKFY